MADPVPVYVQEKDRKGQLYRYGTQMLAETGWDQSKNVAFYAYRVPQEGTTAFYSHRAGDRYQIDQVANAHDGWLAAEDTFYLYPPTHPITGTMPFYIHTAGSPVRQFLDTTAREHDGWSAGTLGFFALPNLAGYKVGDKAADIIGVDQNNKPATLSGVQHGSKGWVLIDVCAVWCGSCQFGAEKTPEFLDSLKSQKLSLKLFTALVSDASSGPTTAADAKAWADTYFAGKEAVINCAGNRKSDLRWLPYKYALANASEAAFPTYVIVDPQGVIQYFQQGVNFNAIQDKLASLSGVGLTGKWNWIKKPNP
jgi:hypothetical protein